MKKRKYLKRIIGVTSLAVVIMALLLFILNKLNTKMLESDLEDKLIAADKQRVFALEKQFAVFETSIKGYALSLAQTSTDGIEKNKIRVKILLRDLSEQLGATSMGICNTKGKGVVGPDIDMEQIDIFRKVVKSGEPETAYVEKGPHGEQECIIFAAPINKDKSGKKYVLYATIARGFLKNVFETSTAYTNQNIMLVGGDASIVFPMENITTQRHVMEQFDSIIKSGDTTVQLELEKDKFYRVGIVKLDKLSWYMVSTVPMSETDVFIKKAVQGLNVLFGCMLAMFIAVIIFIQILLYRHQRNIFTLAYYDSMTGLYNWEHIQNFVSDKIKHYREMSLILFDIKGMKYINELYGYAQGDRIINALADFLRNNSYIEDKYYVYGKLNDDAFAMVVEDAMDDNLKKWVKNYIALMKKEISDDFEVNVSAAIAPIVENEEDNYQNVVDNAYSALNVVRKEGLYSIGIYDEEFKQEQLRQKRLERDLSNAVKNKEFVVYYQPKYDAKTEKLVGAEALVRWQHSEIGFMGPGQFIPIFEKNGMIGKIDMYVLEEVCQKIKDWTNANLEVPSISVNVSRAEINNKGLVKTIKKLRNRYDIDSKAIEIEITESSLLNNEDRLMNISKQLQKAGFSLAIDDFGTGYSSLAQLIRMPLNTIKLDKSFLDSYSKDGKGSNVHVFICDVIQIAKHINCYVVAEGVETKEQRDMLAEAGCDIIQGFYYGKPMPAEEFAKLLQGN